MVGANIEPQDRSLIKRLWWILVIRDAFCASLVGRPFRINLDHCDVDPLTEQDFCYGTASSLSFMQTYQARYSGVYQIHVTKLSLILHHIISARFYPGKQNTITTSSLEGMLTVWRNELPVEFNWSDHTTTEASIFVSTLCILYNHNLILAHVRRPVELGLDDPDEVPLQMPLGEDIASNAAQKIAIASCGVVTTPEGLLPPHELFHGLFIASVVFYMQTKSRSPTTAHLGMSGLTNCKMALHATRDTWDASPWISRLFDKVLCISVNNRQQTTEEQLSSLNTDADLSLNNLSAFDLNSFSMPNEEGWPSQVFLGNFFDVSSVPTDSAPLDYRYDRSGQLPWF